MSFCGYFRFLFNSVINLFFSFYLRSGSHSLTGFLMKKSCNHLLLGKNQLLFCTTNIVKVVRSSALLWEFKARLFSYFICLLLIRSGLLTNFLLANRDPCNFSVKTGVVFLGNSRVLVLKLYKTRCSYASSGFSCLLARSKFMNWIWVTVRTYKTVNSAVSCSIRQDARFCYWPA